VTTADRPALSLAQLEAFDPHPGGGPTERRYNCPLPACAGKPVDRGHQALCANVDTGLYLCNRCGAKGKLTERWDDRSARDLRRVRALRRYTLTPEPTAGTAASAPLLPELLERCQPVAGTPGEAYLFGRGLGLDVATAADVRYVPRCYGRPGVAFRMRDELGAIVAVNVRHTDGRDGVTKTHSIGDRRLGVFATAPGVSTMVDTPLVVVEGPCDALALAECGVPAVALVATRAPRWLRRAAAFRAVYVALDADAEGDRASGELAAELATFARSVERLRPPVGKDWNDALLADYPGLVAFLAGAGL
jgi:hypothetical protein